jgi:two-component system sensor histidine kinase QseC
MTSIRRFMVIVLLASITLLNFIAALDGYRSSMEKSQQLFDKQLAGVAQLLINSGIAGDTFQNTDVHIVDSGIGSIAYQVFNPEHVLLQRSATLPEQSLIPLSPGYSFVNYQGYRWRTFVLQHSLSKYWIVTAERSDIRYALAEEVVLTSVIPIVAELPLIGILIWLVIGWGLKPIKRLAAELRHKDPQDLSPLSESNVVDELSVLVDSSNELLSRLQKSFDRERRFSSDAAHELRTPISALKINLYNLKSIIPEDNESYQLLDLSIQRMSHLIEQMLILYRTVPEQYVNNFQRIDLYDLVKNQIIEQYSHFSDKQQVIELDGEAFEITADVFSLNILLKNLLDNANKYTPDKGNILLTLKREEEDGKAKAILTFDDSGSGIAEEYYGRVFERYYRIEDQKSINTIGSGLGFSIIHHILSLHDGEISLERSCFETGLKVKITLPVDKTRL